MLSETQSRVISNDFDAQDISPAIQMTKKVAHLERIVVFMS